MRTLVVAAVLAALPLASSSIGKAERPRSSVDTAYPAPAGRTLAVAAGGDLQEALDKAAPGDAIVLQAGTVYRGPFTLPRKEGSGWIDNTSPARAGRTTRLEIANNLFIDIGSPGGEGSGTLFQIVNGASGVTIEHNTAFHTGSIIAADMAPRPGLVFRDNIVEHNTYGVFGSGLPALEHYFPGFEFRRNVVIANPAPRRYPADNFYPPSIAGVGFVDYGHGDFRLAAASPLRSKGTRGTDPGAELALVPPPPRSPTPSDR